MKIYRVKEKGRMNLDYEKLRCFTILIRAVLTQNVINDIY